MSMSATVDRPIPPDRAYPLAQREAHAESHILAMAAVGRMGLTITAKVAETYGVPHMVPVLKALKAKFRNELSFGGEK